MTDQSPDQSYGEAPAGSSSEPPPPWPEPALPPPEIPGADPASAEPTAASPPLAPAWDPPTEPAEAPGPMAFPPPPAVPDVAPPSPAAAYSSAPDAFPPPDPGGYAAPPAGGYAAPPAGGYAAPPASGAYLPPAGYSQHQGYPPQQGYPPAAPPYAGPYQAAGVGPHGQPLASWGDRVVASLIDALYQLPFSLLYVVGAVLATVNGGTRSTRGTVITQGNPGLVLLGITLVIISIIGSLVIGILNQIVAQGRTGQSWGKRRRGLRVLHMQTGQPQSVGMNFVRQLAHALDGMAYIGYLWPLWDPMRQTFADKIMNTVVVKER